MIKGLITTELYVCLVKIQFNVVYNKLTLPS